MSSKLEELKMKVRTKFAIPNNVNMKLVLRDGCEIEEDEAFESLSSELDIFFLTDEEFLNLPSIAKHTSSMSTGQVTANSENFISPTSSNSQNLVNLVAKIRKHKASTNINQIAKKRKQSVKLHLGWLCYEYYTSRYVQVKLKTGGGVRMIEVPLSADYQYVLNEAKELFFS